MGCPVKEPKTKNCPRVVKSALFHVRLICSTYFFCVAVDSSGCSD